MAKRRPLKRKRLPQLTESAVVAFRDGDHRALTLALNLAPWEISPLHAHERAEPDLQNCRAEFRIYLSTWRKARELRNMLLDALGWEDEAELV